MVTAVLPDKHIMKTECHMHMGMLELEWGEAQFVAAKMSWTEKPQGPKY